MTFSSPRGWGPGGAERLTAHGAVDLQGERIPQQGSVPLRSRSLAAPEGGRTVLFSEIHCSIS